MKKIISIISIFALIGAGILLTSSSSGKTEVYNPNMGASMFAPDKTQLKVITDKTYDYLRVRVHLMYDYNSEDYGISSGYLFPSLTAGTTYFEMPVLAEFQYSTFCRIDYRVNFNDAVESINLYMSSYLCTKSGGVGSAVYEFRVPLSICEPPADPEK
ncbi:hypothetical protein ACFLTI_06005 [Bacteroidota bacterium]